MHRRGLFLLSLIVVAAGVYASSLPNEFVLDDFAAVVENPRARSPIDIKAIFTTNYWGNRPYYEKLAIYRPLATLTFAITDALGGGAIPGVHRALNILLHVGCVLLVFAVGRRLLRLQGTGIGEAAARTEGSEVILPFLGALLFAVHPVHVEAVAGVVSRAELMAAFFVLLGTLIFLAPPAWWKGPVLSLIFALALLSKENGATLWAVIIGLEFLGWLRRRRQLSPLTVNHLTFDLVHVWLAPVLAAYFILRFAVLNTFLGGDVAFEDNPMVGGLAICRVLTPFKVFFEYLRLLVAPAALTIDYSLNHFKTAVSFTDVKALAGLVFFLGLAAAALLWQSKVFALCASLVCFFATYVVVSNIFFPSTIIMAERLIYLPSAFFLLCVAFLVGDALDGFSARDSSGASPPKPLVLRSPTWTSRLTALGRKLDVAFRSKVAAFLVLLVAVLFAARTVDRISDWRTPMTLYTAAVQTAPDSAKSRHLLANELQRVGRIEDSLPHYSAAVAISPGNFVARTNYARALGKLGSYDKALEQLRIALTLAPSYKPAINVLCAVFERTGRPPRAADLCFPPVDQIP